MKKSKFKNGSFPSYTSRLVIEYLIQSGFESDLDKILSDAKLISLLSGNDSKKLTYEEHFEIVGKAIEISSNSTLGLEIGRRFNFNGAGLLGMASMACRNVLEGLSLLEDSVEVINPSVRISSTINDNYYVIDLEEVYEWGDLECYVPEAVFSAVSACANLLDPFEAKDVVYRMKHRPQALHGVYKEYLSNNVEFQCNKNQILIPVRFTQKLLPLHNPLIVELAREWLEDEESLVLCDRLAIPAYIESYILKNPSRTPTMEHVANHFNVSVRTLNRRLKGSGTSLNEIVINTKKNIAIDYLNRPSLAIDVIAEKLGYTEASNFRKAFKKWTGMTISEFKDAN